MSRYYMIKSKNVLLSRFYVFLAKTIDPPTGTKKFLSVL